MRWNEAKWGEVKWSKVKWNEGWIKWSRPRVSKIYLLSAIRLDACQDWGARGDIIQEYMTKSPSQSKQYLSVSRYPSHMKETKLPMHANLILDEIADRESWRDLARQVTEFFSKTKWSYPKIWTTHSQTLVLLAQYNLYRNSQSSECSREI